jgi:hypothetical protein
MERPSIRSMIIHSLILLFLLHFACFLFSDNKLFDPDTFTHMARLSNILSEGSLRATFLERLNAPYGMELHWTMPFDLFTLAVIAPAAIFKGWQEALDSYAGWVSPVSHVLAVISVLWALKPVLRKNALRIVVYGTILGGYILSYGVFGRVDHHIFMLAFWALWMGAVIRFAMRANQSLFGILAGLFGTVCLWISPETYPGVVWGMGVMMAAWSFRPHRCDRAGWAFALSFPVFCFVALVLDPPRFGFFSVNYYRFSIHTVVLAGLLSMAWLPGLIFLHQKENKMLRFTGMMLSHAFAVIIYWFLYPQVLRPELSLKAAELLSHCVKEYESVFMYSASYFIFSAGRGLMGIFAAFWLLWKDRKRPWSGALGLFVLLLTFYTALAFKHRRFGIYTDVLALIPMAILAVRGMTFLHKKNPSRAAVLSAGIFLLILFAPQLGGLLAFSAEKTLFKKTEAATFGTPAGTDPKIIESLKRQLNGREKSCRLDDIVPPLVDPAAFGKEAITIAADLSWSPELLYRTPHRYISGPYGHYDALKDVIQFMYTGSVSGAREIARIRKVDYVLMCPSVYGWYEPPKSDSLFARVAKNQPVEWLEEVSWPASVKTDFRLWRVRR